MSTGLRWELALACGALGLGLAAAVLYEQLAGIQEDVSFVKFATMRSNLREWEADAKNTRADAETGSQAEGAGEAAH